MNNIQNPIPYSAPEIDARQFATAGNQQAGAVGSGGIVDRWQNPFMPGKSSAPEHLNGETGMPKSFITLRNSPVRRTFTMNGEYQETRQGVTSLLYVEEDEDFARPTPYALGLALDLLENTNAELITHGNEFPKGVSSASGTGGIYIFWGDKDVSVQLEVPPRDGGMFYIHVMSRAGSSMNRNVCAKALADALAASSPSNSRRLGVENAPASAVA